MIGHAFGQLDAGCIRDRTGPDFGKGKGGVVGGDDDVRAHRQLQPPTTGNAVDCCDHRLVHVSHFLQATEPTNAIIPIHGIPTSSGLQIPSGAEEFVTTAGDDRNAQVVVVAEIAKHFAHDPAGLQINCICLGPVQRDLQNGTVLTGLHRGLIGHIAGSSIAKGSLSGSVLRVYSAQRAAFVAASSPRWSAMTAKAISIPADTPEEV